jgi:hypothetical protein
MGHWGTNSVCQGPIAYHEVESCGGQKSLLRPLGVRRQKVNPGRLQKWLIEAGSAHQGLGVASQWPWLGVRTSLEPFTMATFHLWCCRSRVHASPLSIEDFLKQVHREWEGMVSKSRWESGTKRSKKVDLLSERSLSQQHDIAGLDTQDPRPTQNLHFQKIPLVVWMHIQVWEAVP